MGPLLIEAFRYNKWANLHLLDVCSGLSDEQLQLTVPGTYGTIAATLMHLLAAEQRYLRRLGLLAESARRRRAVAVLERELDALKRRIARLEGAV